MTPGEINQWADRIEAEGPAPHTVKLLRALSGVQEAAENLLRIEPNASEGRQIALAEVLATRVRVVMAIEP